MKNSGIVERLNIAKKQRGLTLQKLAEKSQLTVGTVNKIMSGALLDIKMDKLQKLAKALDVTTEYLLGNESNQQISDTPTVAETHYLGMVKIACVSPQVRVADCVYNAEKIVEGVNKAVKDGAKIVLFPELSITAYTCGDLFFQRTLRQSAIDGLRIVCQKTAKTDAVVGQTFQCCRSAFSRGHFGNCAQNQPAQLQRILRKTLLFPCNRGKFLCGN